MDFTFQIDEFIEHQHERTFTFPLYASSVGRKDVFKAVVHRLSLMDRASIGHLPDTLQNEVWLNLKDAQKDIQKMSDEGTEPKDITEALARTDKYARAANLYCEAAFIKPKITVDKRKEDLDNGVMHVERINAEDRIQFMLACNDAESEAARRFVRFREQSTSDAPVGDTVDVAGRAPVTDIATGREPDTGHDNL